MEMQKEDVIHQEAAVDHDTGVCKQTNGLQMHEQAQLSPEESKIERRLVWKIDFIVLPLLSLMYFLASMDRGDIGNAAVAGMNKELKITPQQYSNCVAFFYIGYIVLQLPATLFIRKIQPQYQLGMAMIGWGLSTTVISVAKNWGTVAGLRTLIGCFEAFLQAGPLYLTFWYRPAELATRGSIFFAMSAVAGTMNGLIAYGISKNMEYIHGWYAWRWIFLIEGVISVGCGFIVMLLLPPVPERVRRFFSPSEKDILLRRTKEAYNTPHTGIKTHQLLAVLKDKKIWCFAFFYSMMNISLTSFSGFLPVILKGLGYSTVKTQLLTIPVYVCTGVTLIISGIVSDKMRKRGVFLATSFATAAAGWLILLLSTSQRLSYAGCFLVGMGTFPTVTLIQSWMSVLIIGYTKRAGALAFIMVCGQCFAVMGLEIFTDAPKYHRGKGLGFTANALSALLVPFFQLYLMHLNRKKDENQHSPEAAAKRLLGIEEHEGMATAFGPLAEPTDTVLPVNQRTLKRLDLLEREIQELRGDAVTVPVPGSGSSPRSMASAATLDHAATGPSIDDGIDQLPARNDLVQLLSSLDFFSCCPHFGDTQLSVSAAGDLILEFYVSYHPLLPVLPDIVTFAKNCHSCVLLFWAVVAISARSCEPHQGLNVALSEPIRQLAGSELFSKGSSSLSTIHALLIMAYWPLPFGASSEDPSWLYCGAAVHRALGLGLHRPAAMPDFVNWALVDEKTIQMRQKTWLACFIVNQNLSTRLGIPSTIKVDHTINQALRQWPAMLPKILKQLLQISHKSFSFTNILGHFEGAPDGLLPEPSHVVETFEADLNALEETSWGGWSLNVRAMYLWTKLQLYCYTLTGRGPNSRGAGQGILAIAHDDYKEAYYMSQAFSTALQTIDTVCAISNRKEDTTQNLKTATCEPDAVEQRPWTGFERAALVYATMFILKLTRFSKTPVRGHAADNAIRKALTALKLDRTPLKHDSISRVCDIIEYVCQEDRNDAIQFANETMPYSGDHLDRSERMSRLRPMMPVRSRMSQNITFEVVQHARSRFESEAGQLKYPYSSRRQQLERDGRPSEEIGHENPNACNDISQIASRLGYSGIADDAMPEASLTNILGPDHFDLDGPSFQPGDIFWADWDLGFA